MTNTVFWAPWFVTRSIISLGFWREGRKRRRVEDRTTMLDLFLDAIIVASKQDLKERVTHLSFNTGNYTYRTFWVCFWKVPIVTTRIKRSFNSWTAMPAVDTRRDIDWEPAAATYRWRRSESLKNSSNSFFSFPLLHFWAEGQELKKADLLLKTQNPKASRSVDSKCNNGSVRVGPVKKWAAFLGPQKRGGGLLNKV